MAISFKIEEREGRAGKQMIKVLLDEKFVAVIYQDGEDGLNVVSSYVAERYIDERTGVPVFSIRFSPSPSTAKNGKQVKA